MLIYEIPEIITFNLNYKIPTPHFCKNMLCSECNAVRFLRKKARQDTRMD